MASTGDFSTAKGYDGKTAWVRALHGAVRELGAGERERELLMNWILCGHWADARAPLDLALSRRGSSRKVVPLDVTLPGSGFGGKIKVDTKTWLPRSFHITDFGRDMVIRLKVWDEGTGRPLPRRVELLDDGELKAEIDFTVLRAVERFEGGFFSPARETAVVRYPEAPVELAVRRGRWGHHFVRARINGEELGWFAVDTGATASMIHTRHAKGLGLPLVGDSRGAGLGGKTWSTMYRAESIELGGLRLESLPVAGFDMRGMRLGLDEVPAGIIGMDLLARAVIVYDQAGSKITLHDPAHYELPLGEWQLMTDYLGKPTVSMRYEQHEGSFTIDTGNPGGIILSPLTVERLDLLRGRDTTSATLGGFGGTVRAQRGLLAWVEWGGRRFDHVPADFITDNRGVVSDQFRDGVIGTDLLRRYVVVFDMTHRRIAYLPREEASVSPPGKP